ncbi:MAG: dihydropteroate synthase [Bacteroidales bacterium]
MLSVYQEHKQRHFLNVSGKLLDLSTPLVMGVVNLTPDSYYRNSRHSSLIDALDKAEQMLAEGACIIDIGGCSTRPGAEEITAEKELDRILDTCIALRKKYPELTMSIDTFRADVVEAVFNEIGGFIVNDISGGDFDPNMFKVIAKLNLPYVINHTSGTPETMQNNTNYKDVVMDIVKTLQDKHRTLTDMGVNDVIVDPGFGFGKTLAQNYTILKNLDKFLIIDAPLLVGISRKSMIQQLLDVNADKALNGTSTAHTIALQKGADILRVHDVKEAIQCVEMFNYLNTIE